MKNVDISVVIPTVGRKEELLTTLRCISQQDIGKENFEVIMSKTNQIVTQVVTSLSNRLRASNKYPKLIPKEDAVEPMASPPAEKKAPKPAPPPARKSSPADGPTPSICPACEVPLPTRAKFCMECGAKIEPLT